MSVEERALRERFWERFSLGELNAREWEALCDGCGQCCLMREVDDSRGEVVVYSVGCPLLDVDTSRCTDYPNRLSRMKSCHKLTPENVPEYDWLPKTCAYRRVYKGKPLEKWHPLLAGDREKMIRKGHSVCGFALPYDGVPRRRLHRYVFETWSSKPKIKNRKSARRRRG